MVFISIPLRHAHFLVIWPEWALVKIDDCLLKGIPNAINKINLISSLFKKSLRDVLYVATVDLVKLEIKVPKKIKKSFENVCFIKFCSKTASFIKIEVSEFLRNKGI